MTGGLLKQKVGLREIVPSSIRVLVSPPSISTACACQGFALSRDAGVLPAKTDDRRAVIQNVRIHNTEFVAKRN